MSKGYIIVEGHGEVKAAGNLINRLAADIGVTIPWAPPLRWKNLHKRDGVIRAANYIRSQPDVSAMLLLRDEDDACPRDRGPEMAEWLREQDLPFPSAVVLLHPEYEVLFLPCIATMAGRSLGSGVSARPGLMSGTRWTGSWESKRGVKEWLSAHFPPNRAYKPTLDQLPFTRMVEIDKLRAANLPCFDTLERAVGFIGTRVGTKGVYPPRRPRQAPRPKQPPESS